MIPRDKRTMDVTEIVANTDTSDRRLFQPCGEGEQVTTVYVVTSTQLKCEGVFSTEDKAQRRIKWLQYMLHIYASYNAETLDTDVISD